jgi:6-phosphogluconolactonase
LGEGNVIQHTGSGSNAERQKSAHPHGAFISSDNKMLYVTDLGMDKLMLYNFDQGNGKLTPADPAFIASVAGSGPRKMEQFPDDKYRYVIEELSGTIQVYKQTEHLKLKPIQRISTMRKGDEQFAGSADIHLSPDRRFLYASNRGEVNNMAIFKVKNNGKLKLKAHQSTLGKSPRNFTIDPSGNFLLVGNQNSEEIVIFNRNKKTGLLTDSGNRISVGKPVCLKWISYN